MKSRGIKSSQVLKYDIGLCKRAVELEGTSSTIYPGRITVPLINAYDETLGFLLRKYKEDGREGSKYTKVNIGDLSGHLYGFKQALPEIYRTGTVLLVEGSFDLYAVEPYFPACVAMLTSRLHKDGYEQLRRYADRLIFCLDNDKTGLEQQHWLRQNPPKGFSTSIVQGRFKDPSDWRSKDKASLEEYFTELKEIYLC